MANLSRLRRERMFDFLNNLKVENRHDEKILQSIAEIENELNEKKYGLVWEEHSEEVDERMVDNVPILLEDKSREIATSGDDKYSFLIEGDNLHSLKLLDKTHHEKIDVIYIDPPYNTGNGDFMYDDNYVGADDGYRHSKWLSFMNSRLRLAKELLRDTGIIFISINDIENAQLKMLMDDIFDESNFIGQLVWESTTQPTNAGSAKFQLQKKTEPIYCYAKNKFARNGFLLKSLSVSSSYPHKGKYGACRFEIIEKSDAGAYRRDSMKYKILGQEPRPGKRWQIGEETARKLEAEGKLEIVNGIVKRAVYPEDEGGKESYAPFWSLLLADQVKTAQTGKDELNKVLNRAVGFDTVKPVALMKELFSHFDNNVQILDFFAGSGTTAQAVLELNKEDGGSRKFILCTNNESGICSDVTYPRIKTVVTGIRPDGSGYSDGIPANVKYYKTEFVAKDNETLVDDLIAHTDEMIQLEYGVQIDKDKYISILTDEEANELFENWDKYPNIRAIYVSRHVILNAEQRKLFYTKGVYIIPDYYYREELREVGE